ncbi:hypothetical protein pEaSNUABM21_00218 [Erwinia phage pEa_SNUABM_21]|nr:hypothetical protein pEaSNUABM21_00218 [Erwinia phage pEa_SNUABM_21]
MIKKAVIKPKKVIKKFVYPKSLPFADFLHMYELYCFRHLTLDQTGYRTWPDVTLEEAYNSIVEKGLTIDDVLREGNHISQSYRDSGYLFNDLNELDKDIGELRSAFIDRRCHLGYAIPLLLQTRVQVMNRYPDMRLTFAYAWAACVKEKLISETKAEKAAIKHNGTERGSQVTFEIECTLEQAQRLEEYIQIRVDAYNYWSDKMRTILKDRRRVNAGPPVSEVVTEFRKSLKGKVPRSLVSRSMNHAMFDWQKWLDSKRSASKKPEGITVVSHNSVSLSNAFSFDQMDNALTFGEVKDIAITQVVEGQLEPTRPFKYLIVNGRKKPDSLVFVVTGQYK